LYCMTSFWAIGFGLKIFSQFLPTSGQAIGFLFLRSSRPL
jgi:hypothetical protein